MARQLRFLVVLTFAIAYLADARSIQRRTVVRQALSPSDELFAANGASVGADGRFVAFTSRAALLPDDTNPGDDIYVLDRESSKLTLETRSQEGSSVSGNNRHPRLSQDGRYVAFESGASTLAGNPDADLNGMIDVFVRDRLRATTRRISQGTAIPDTNGGSFSPAISADGSIVAFASTATNLVPGVDANGSSRDIYVIGTDKGTMSRESVGRDGRQPSAGESYAPSLSRDGAFVAFSSTSDLLGSARSPSHSAVYVRDRASQITSCITCTTELSRGAAETPHISENGRFLVFAWGDRRTRSTHNRIDIALHDRTTNVTTIITKQANGNSVRPRISGNGRLVAFESLASNLGCDKGRCPHVTRDENLVSDIYLFDRQTGSFTRLSADAGEWWVPSVGPWLDREGTVVVFSSREPLGPEDLSIDFDLFVKPLTARR